MKYCKVSLSVSQMKQQQKRMSLISFLSMFVMKKVTDIKVELKLRTLRVRNQFLEQSRN
jgi:hypothetical protein